MTLKHIKSLILLKKLVSMSNFNVFILMFVICFLFGCNVSSGTLNSTILYLFGSSAL